MIKLTEDTNSHQNKWPQKLITASLAVSKQILHSKLAFAFGCSLFDAPEAEDGSFVEGISPPEVAILFSVAMLILTPYVTVNWALERRFMTANRKRTGKDLLVGRHHGE